MAFVVSGGTLRTIEQPLAPAPYALQLTDELSQDYASIWRSQPSVRTVVTFLARNIASLGLHLYRRVSDTDRERQTDHPFAQLLSRPNPNTTRYRLIDALVHDLGIYDEAFWLKMRDRGEPQALVRIPPTKIKPADENWLQVGKYVVEGNRGKVEVPADAVVHFRGYNPDDPRVGHSPLESLRRILVEEYEAGRMREQTLRNGARMSGYIKRPPGASWSKEAKQNFRAQWHAQYAGSGPQAGGTPILEDGMEFVPAAMTAEQLQYIESRKLTREEVASAYFIPPPMVGILEHATFSNISEQHKMLYQDTLGPWLTMIVEELALQLLPEFDTTGDMYLEFNLSEKLRGSFEEQAQQLQASVGAPWLSRNEARARMNLPAVDNGDELVTPLNVLVGGQASPRDSAPPGAGELSAVRRGKWYDTGGSLRPGKRNGSQRKDRAPQTHEEKYGEVLVAFFRRQSRAVRSRLGAGEQWWDADRWDGELADDLYRLAVQTSETVATSVLDAIGFGPDEYSVERTLNFLRAVAERQAGSVNKVTKSQLDEALDDDEPTEAVTHVFETAESHRVGEIAATAVTAVSGFAATEAAKQVSGDRATKTWNVTSQNPRTSHARMDGETVGIEETFSNGALWPADSSLDVDEVAGCRCAVTINVP